MCDYKNTDGALQTYSDEELLQQMADDDRQAFTTLYHRYWEDLFITAAKALRGKEEAADILQDVFLSLWNRRNKMDIRASLAAYLHTSVRYKCIHYIEKNITRRDYLLRIAHMEVNDSFPDAEINLQLKEIQNIINKAVETMPAKMREAYRLSRHEYLTHKEIAEYMSISVGTVKKHIQHALQLIRTSFPPHTFILVIAECFYLVDKY